MTKEDKKLLTAQAQMLVMLGIAVEKERRKLKELVERGVPYDAPEMLDTLQRFETADAEWKRLEAEHIIHYLNGNGVKTSLGNPYNKNSIRRILTNDKYIGMYRYNGIEVADGVPPIIDNETFEKVQLLMEKNKKAPARMKAVEGLYLLSMKLFCGHCKCAMTGFSGTSHTEKFYQYYGCVTQRKHGRNCKKKAVRKEYVEDMVVEKVLSVLNDEYIDTIAQKIAGLSAKESNTDTVKRLKRLLKENEDATANLVKAIESGKAVDILSAQIEKRQAERADLEVTHTHLDRQIKHTENRKQGVCLQNGEGLRHSV